MNRSALSLLLTAALASSIVNRAILSCCLDSNRAPVILPS
jgi:hypothetical protein